MVRLVFKIRPASDFGSRLTGGMLFGHVAWRVRETFGEARLQACLAGYEKGAPFLVLSDAFPSGFAPLPAIPTSWWAETDYAAQRKRLKAKRWLPLKALKEPLSAWSAQAVSDAELPRSCAGRAVDRQHNTISRLLASTTSAGFAPYVVSATSFSDEAQFDVYADLDEERLGRDELGRLLEDVGTLGYGRDASTGLGRFEVEAMNVLEPPPAARCWLALSAMSPGGAPFDADKCFYRPITYFGRHGNVRALGGTPFKKPIVLADAGAWVTLTERRSILFAGHGIKGHSAYADTVHQGYAPLLPILGADHE